MGAPATCLPVEPGLVGVRWMAGFVGALSLPLDGMSLCAVIWVNIVIVVYRGLRVYSVAEFLKVRLRAPVIQLLCWFTINVDS